MRIEIPYPKYFTLPPSSVLLCRTASIYFLGISQTLFYKIMKEVACNKSLATHPHGLKVRSGEDSSRYSIESNKEIRKAIEDLCSEQSIDPPWFIKPAIYGKHVMLLPPYFSKDLMYRRLCISIPEHSRLSRTQFFELIMRCLGRRTRRIPPVALNLPEDLLCHWGLDLVGSAIVFSDASFRLRCGIEWVNQLVGMLIILFFFFLRIADDFEAAWSVEQSGRAQSSTGAQVGTPRLSIFAAWWKPQKMHFRLRNRWSRSCRYPAKQQH